MVARVCHNLATRGQPAVPIGGRCRTPLSARAGFANPDLQIIGILISVLCFCALDRQEMLAGNGLYRPSFAHGREADSFDRTWHRSDPAQSVLVDQI